MKLSKIEWASSSSAALTGKFERKPQVDLLTCCGPSSQAVTSTYWETIWAKWQNLKKKQKAATKNGWSDKEVKTNQGQEVQLTMMLRSLRRACSCLLCEAAQSWQFHYFHLHSTLVWLMWCSDGYAGYEHDVWTTSSRNGADILWKAIGGVSRIYRRNKMILTVKVWICSD